MRVIWKFPLESYGRNTVNMPCLARVLHVGLDPQGNPCLWAEVDPTVEKADRQFYIVGTSHTLPPEARAFVGTFMQPPFVWHVYADRQEPTHA